MEKRRYNDVHVVAHQAATRAERGGVVSSIPPPPPPPPVFRIGSVADSIPPIPHRFSYRACKGQQPCMHPFAFRRGSKPPLFEQSRIRPCAMDFFKFWYMHSIPRSAGGCNKFIILNILAPPPPPPRLNTFRRH